MTTTPPTPTTGPGTALVTGASGGIGEQFARQLAATGHGLVLVARREERLRELREELVGQHPGLEVDVVAADLSRAGSADEVAAAVREAGRTVTVLVNNAGTGSHDRFVDEDRAALVRQIQLNCTTLVELTAHFLPPMLAAGGRGAAVVNVASTAAFQPVPTMAVYGATKAFVLSFTEALWGEVRSSGVRVVALCPGPTETAFFTATGSEFLTSGRQSPQEVAAAALRAVGKKVVVVPGLANRLSASGYRFLPRTVLTRVSQRVVRAR